jgi:integrase
VRHGCGEIELRGARYRVRAYVDGRRTPLGTYATEAEAKSVLDGLVALRARGDVAATGPTLRSYGAQWLDRREVDGMRAQNSDRSRWERYIAPEEWAGWPLGEVRRRDVREWVSSLRKRQSARDTPLSPQTILHCVKLVSTCFRAALDDELIEKNPIAGLRVERPRPSPEMWTHLTVDEQKELATCPLGARTERETFLIQAERLIALVAVGTGIRQGEQWNLELRDVHVDDAEPWLFVRWGSKGQPPKNGKARRVPLFGLALAAMKEWLRLLPRYAPENPEELVFPTERGCRRQKSKLPRRWARILKAAKLDAPDKRHDGHAVRWHDLRHTCASSLVAGWWGKPWRLEMVRDVLGHSTVTITERYAHLSPSVLDEAGAAMVAPRFLAAADATTVPASVPDGVELDLQARDLVGRAMHDSNMRPSASEADTLSS